jgi:hypothetical protein
LKQVAGVADALNPAVPSVVSVFAGRIADTGIDPMPIMRASGALLEGQPKAELLWASTREVLNIFHAEESGCADHHGAARHPRQGSQAPQHGPHRAFARYGQDVCQGRRRLRLHPVGRPRNSAFTSAADWRTFAVLPLSIMSFRIRPALLATLALLGTTIPFVAATPDDDAEAQRLYDRANDYVNSITEDGYSYSYLQFHWKRSQANIDRILEVYPETPNRQGGEIRPAQARALRPRLFPRSRALPA